MSDKMNNTIYNTGISQELKLVLIVVGLIVLLALVIWFAKFVNDFSRELRILNIEIRRSEGSERRHWLRARRRLWLSLLPFFKY